MLLPVPLARKWHDAMCVPLLLGYVVPPCPTIWPGWGPIHPCLTAGVLTCPPPRDLPAGWGEGAHVCVCTHSAPPPKSFFLPLPILLPASLPPAPPGVPDEVGAVGHWSGGSRVKEFSSAELSKGRTLLRGGVASKNQVNPSLPCNHHNIIYLARIQKP